MKITMILLIGALSTIANSEALKPESSPVKYQQEKGNLPFSSSAEIDRWLMLSGQIGIDSSQNTPQLAQGEH